MLNRLGVDTGVVKILIQCVLLLRVVRDGVGDGVRDRVRAMGCQIGVRVMGCQIGVGVVDRIRVLM